MPRSADNAVKQQIKEMQKTVTDIEKQIKDAPDGENTEALEMALVLKQEQMRRLKEGQEQHDEDDQENEQASEQRKR